MRFLALTTRHIESRHSGYDLRVANLCAHLPGEVHLVVAPYRPVDDPRPGLHLDGVFDSVEELTSLRHERARRRRHLRLSNTHFLVLSRPVAFASARSRLAEIVRARGITHVVVFGGELAELAADLGGPDVPGDSEGSTGPDASDAPRVLLDVCDSTTLTARRARRARRPGTGPRAWARQVKEILDVVRKQRTEARFPGTFDLVTTISDPDARAVEGARGAHGTVRTVPNGLDEAYVRPLSEAGRRHGVVFWGNLAFGPNRDALRFFVHEVFLPRLRDRGVELCVIGVDAPSWLVELAANEPSITLPGYVEDLPATVSRYPIMINPMCSGSGLKNKVLEAFGLGLAVVSTPIGVEALPDTEDGRHLALAEGPAEFAATVLALLEDGSRRERMRASAHALVHQRYLWSTVGQMWRALIPAGRYPDEQTVPGPRTYQAQRPSALQG